MFGIKNRLGFGMMRLPMIDGKIDEEQCCKMVDAFIQNGFNYFDTAHGYLGELSETAVNHCVTSRYPREDYILTDKLSSPYFNRQEDIRPFFESQLAVCGVDYFDFYLMHAQDRTQFRKYKECHAYETAMELLKEGKIRHLGISFHDKASVLEEILSEYPQVEVVQLQFNYLDFEDASVQSRKCYEVCRKHNKPVLVMEPVKGGSLVELPDEAKAILDDTGSGSYASYAIRFAAGFDGVMVVLSGMGSMEMVLDNISTMKSFKPLDVKEMEAISKVCGIIRGKSLIPCTACHYCTDGCPKRIPIPELFACMNTFTNFKNWNASYYTQIYTSTGGKASECLRCGKCEKNCPQHLPIRDLLEKVAQTFEKK